MAARGFGVMTSIPIPYAAKMCCSHTICLSVLLTDTILALQAAKVSTASIEPTSLPSTSGTGAGSSTSSSGVATGNTTTATSTVLNVSSQQQSSRLSVVDLRCAELATPSMVESLAAAHTTQQEQQAAGAAGPGSSGPGGKGGSGSIATAGVWVGLQRYALHVPTLHGELSCNLPHLSALTC